MDNIPELFLEVATQAEKHAAPQVIEKLLTQLYHDCEMAAAAAKSKEIREVFAQIQKAVETWKSVWPRLGSQQEFRSAVVREARAWSNRLKDSLLEGNS